MSADDAVETDDRVETEDPVTDDPVADDAAAEVEGLVEATPEAGDAVEEDATTEEELPILTVRETVIFPGAMLPITVGRPSSIALVQSMGENRRLAVVSQLDPRVETPSPDDLYRVGTVCVLHKALRVPRDNLLLFCEGIARIRTGEFTSTDPFLRAHVERIPDIEPPITPEVEALRQNVSGAVSADCDGLAQPFRRSFDHRQPDCASPGGWPISWPAICPALSPPERQKLLEQHRRRAAPERHAPPPDARTGTAGAARPHSIAGAGAAFAEPARVLSARAVEGHPEGAGRGRRSPAAISKSCARNWKPPA